MAINATKTAHFTRYSILRDLNIPFSVNPHSTLNQKFSSPGAAVGSTNPPSTGYPSIKYLAIGNGGLIYSGNGATTLATAKLHGPKHAGLFNQIPFRLVPKVADLSNAEQSQYRLKVPVTKVTNGVSADYYAYYLKVFNTTNLLVHDNIVTISGGKVVNSMVWTPSPSDLTNPTPVQVSNVSVNSPDGTYLVSSAAIPIALNADEIGYIVDACTVLFGDPGYAVLSELAIVGGFDYQEASNGPAYTEVQAAQVFAYINLNISLSQLPTAINIPVSFGESLSNPPNSI